MTHAEFVVLLIFCGQGQFPRTSMFRASLRTTLLRATARRHVPARLLHISPIRKDGNADTILSEDMSEVKLEPAYRPNEPTETKRARLFYQSRKRGILETCVILGKFGKEYLHTLSREELEDYDQFMNENDWDIFYWITDAPDSPRPCPERWENSSIMKKMRKVGRNEKREIMRLPDLD